MNYMTTTTKKITLLMYLVRAVMLSQQLLQLLLRVSILGHAGERERERGHCQRLYSRPGNEATNTVASLTSEVMVGRL